MNTDKDIDVQTTKSDVQPEYLEQALTGKILECAFTVHNDLGAGFLERVYSNALTIELVAADLKCVQQASLAVKYRGSTVGEYFADILVEDRVLLELKACASLDPNHSAQIMRASGVRVGLLMNFGRP